MCKVGAKGGMIAEEISTITKKPNSFYWNILKGRCLEDISEIIKMPTLTKYHSVNISFEERAPGTPVWEGSQWNVFFSTHFIILSHSDMQTPLQPWSRWTQLKLAEDFSTIHVMLVLQACKIQESWDHRGFHSDFKEGLGELGICHKALVSGCRPWECSARTWKSEIKAAVEIPGSWKCQEHGMPTKPAQERDHVYCNQ